jgi:hypothetical protein
MLAVPYKTHLEAMISSGKVPHLLLFLGEYEETLKAAQAFAENWLHSLSPVDPHHALLDIHHMKVEGKIGMHSVSSIRDMLEKAFLAPFQAKGKVFIIEEADRMLPASSNAILKTIEEPPANTLFLLLTHNQEKLLPTVRSRCQVVRFRGDEKAEEAHAYPYLEKLRQAFASGINIRTIFQFCDEVHQEFEEKRKSFEKAVKVPSKDELKEMNAVQRHKLEQESEGEISSEMQHEIQLLLGSCARYYRECSQAHKESIKLEKVDAALSFTKLALDRSMPLKNALETFFLRLL